MNAHHWLLFLPAAILMAASPGAGNFLALNNGLRAGAAAAIVALAGRCAAFAILILLVLVGVGALLSASVIAFSALKWAGVAYLVWLGIRLWRSEELPVEDQPSRMPPSRRQLMAREFIVAVTNPKAFLLFTAFLPQFIVPGRPMPSQFLMLGGSYILIEFVAASGYALAGSRITSLRPTRQAARWINRLTGGLFFAAAGYLAAMKRAV